MEKAPLGYNSAPNTISELENTIRGCLGELDHCLPGSFVRYVDCHYSFSGSSSSVRKVPLVFCSPYWGCWQKEGRVWTAMVSVENWTFNVNDHAMKIRWTSLQIVSRHKEQNSFDCRAREANMCPERWRHPNPQPCSYRVHFHLCALMILAFRCHSLLCLKNLKPSKETSLVIFHWQLSIGTVNGLP